MNRLPHVARFDHNPDLVLTSERGSDAPISCRFLKLALVCYLSPVILLVFAIGGLAIAAGRMVQIAHSAGELLRLKPTLPRRLVSIPIHSRRSQASRFLGLTRRSTSWTHD